ncbi:MAG: Stk1 family PASTA domain-containing Ser/Thr kinase [Clostridia bacterium]|nr:Stk1 family PASTA domain-containing Ser/Thr kinase [Clostridia bacterium]
MMKGVVFAERYQLGEFIGQGGMSLVYRAVDIRTGHSVAVKILKSEYSGDAEFLVRFQREAHAASLMAHHNIVNLLDVGVEGEYRYLVLEYVQGSTLKEIILQKGRLSTNAAIQITIRILSALQHAHDNGIIHRDIKPQNVLVHDDGHVKVADFGIARMTNAFTISKGDTVVGSVHYSSPEQAAGAVVDSTSDLYSAGVVIYEMLTGHVPFTGDNAVAVAMQHINAVPPSILEDNQNVPPPVVAAVMKALEKSPRRRYQSAREMADALTKARDGKAEPAAPPLFAEGGGGKPAGQQGAAPSIQNARSQDARQGYQAARAPASKGNKSSFWPITLAVIGVLGMLLFGVIQIYTQLTNSAVSPELVGLPVDEAQNLVRRARLNWRQTELHHTAIPEGVVIAQIPEPDTAMVKGDSVVVTVSLGPVTSDTPDLVGSSLEEAAVRLKEKGLGMVVFKIASTEPLDKVLSQNPLMGQPCPVSMEVEVTVSGGSAMVPDVADMGFEAARALLQENSLSVGKIEYAETQDQRLIGKVVAQTPTAGTMAVLDAAVTLTMARQAMDFHSEVSVVLPEAQDGRTLRVILVEEGAEVEQYINIVPASATMTTLLVPLSSNRKGAILCRVYLNDVLWDEREVQLQ